MLVNPANICLFKFNNKNIRKRCETCSKLTMKRSERRLTYLIPFDVLKYFWTYFTPFSTVSVVDFEQVNISCDVPFISMLFQYPAKLLLSQHLLFSGQQWKHQDNV